MLFKFLEKPIEITAFVSSNYSFANTYSPIKPSSHFIPDWWKNTPKSSCFWENNQYMQHKTTKSCLGIIGTFQNGYIMPMWSDLSFKIHEDGAWNYQFSDALSEVGCHKNMQIPNFYNNYIIFKLGTPWHLQSSENLKLMYCDPFYSSEEKKYHVPYGIIPDIDKKFSTNTFIFIERKSNEILIKHNTPILHIIPLTERKIKFKTEVISSEELTRKVSTSYVPITFNSKGLNMLKILRRQKNG